MKLWAAKIILYTPPTIYMTNTLLSYPIVVIVSAAHSVCSRTSLSEFLSFFGRPTINLSSTNGRFQVITKERQLLMFRDLTHESVTLRGQMLVQNDMYAVNHVYTPIHQSQAFVE